MEKNQVKFCHCTKIHSKGDGGPWLGHELNVPRGFFTFTVLYESIRFLHFYICVWIHGLASLLVWCSALARWIPSSWRDDENIDKDVSKRKGRFVEYAASNWLGIWAPYESVIFSLSCITVILGLPLALWSYLNKINELFLFFKRFHNAAWLRN